MLRAKEVVAVVNFYNTAGTRQTTCWDQDARPLIGGTPTASRRSADVDGMTARKRFFSVERDPDTGEAIVVRKSK